MIAIVDYGVGNLSSIKNMLKKVGAESIITKDISVIKSARKLILPGIGSFDYCVSKLNESGCKETLISQVCDSKIPVLGICVGLQLMGKSSEEGKLQGLGWIDAACVKFKFPNSDLLKIPHMGWGNVFFRKESKLLLNMYPDPRFYFVHSYHLECEDPGDVLLTAHYGYDFACAIEKENIYGVQFHPEKSHKFGMKLIENFVRL